ncbi:hypothetical protein EG347_16335 [Chryseobacterium sp. G0186]|uniref:hypothetical protein n=1 Tax=Chryseobacterium sp. G0186 TaxID=2487064 RepID=UPI000F4FF86B|nr:hypothetical protein [Chryseobacterium sp. G0186]AZA78969.1 hypothetical protein EG347_16335 [Chryseobacterium sp. G0186]
MKVKDTIYCNNIGVYHDQLTKRKSYIIEEINFNNIRICNDENKLKWYSKFYFSFNNDPEIASIHIDDEILDEESDAVEVTIEFTNSDKYWMTFSTPKYLDLILNDKPYFSVRHFIFIKKLNEDIIKSTIHELDKQNELIQICKKY